MLAVRSAEHHWLFPQVAAVIHHGGGGTTAAGLRAGVPSILTPFFADQPFWARRVYELGVGPAPIPHRKLTAEKLAAAIRRATGDESIRARAAELGKALRAEDGVGRAAAIFETYVENWSGTPAGAAI
jgi:UDP:flavonoid glycosyltransferase YjiC (YdhE family)